MKALGGRSNTLVIFCNSYLLCPGAKYMVLLSGGFQRGGGGGGIWVIKTPEFLPPGAGTCSGSCMTRYWMCNWTRLTVCPERELHDKLSFDCVHTGKVTEWREIFFSSVVCAECSHNALHKRNGRAAQNWEELLLNRVLLWDVSTRIRGT